MANKQLTASVRLNTTQAEKSIERLANKIQSINKAINKISTNNVGQKFENAATKATKMKQVVDKVNTSVKQVEQNTNRLGSGIDSATKRTSLLNSLLSSTRSKIQSVVSHATTGNSVFQNISGRISNIVSKVRSWWSNQKQVHSATRSTNNILSSTLSKLKAIAATYLGIMGTRAAINTADTITSAENKLNYVAAQQLGEKAYNSDGSYSDAVFQSSVDSMDKMYASANKVRLGYTDMMNNVSKSMVLAGDSFQNSTDNAIRFQEIMSEAYVVGGASASEMSTSMYQMIQALGAGTLAGDELRSVREGAPLAYKAIEEFVQGVYKSKDSLKDLASEGLVTSDMVVAAIMNAGDKIDSAFEKTEMTFAQAWTRIKNTAVKAFEPVARMLREMLNTAIDNGLFEKIEAGFVTVSKALQIVFKAVGKAISWIADNWYWLEGVLISGLITYGILMVATAIKSAVAWVIANWPLLLIAGTIFAIIYLLYQWQNGVISTTEVIQAVLLGLFIFIIAWIIKIAITILIGTAAATAGVSLIVLAVIAAILIIAYLFFAFTEQVCGWTWVVVSFIINLIQSLVNIIITLILLLAVTIYNIIALIVNFVMAGVSWLVAVIQNGLAFIGNLIGACVLWIIALVTNCINGIINLACGLWNSIQAITTNIGIAFENGWNAAKSAFWSFVADVLNGIKWLEPAINAVARAFGKEGFTLSGVISNVESKANSYKQKSYVSVGDAWSSGMNTKSYTSLGDAWDAGMSKFSYADLGDAWSKGWNTLEFGSWSKAIEDGSSFIGTGLSDWNWKDAYNTGSDWGANFKDSINAWGSDKSNKLSEKLKGITGGNGISSVLDNIGKSLGLDFGDQTGTGGSGLPGGSNGTGGSSGFPNANDPKYDVGKAYKAPTAEELLRGVDDIADGVGSIADSMDLTNEDLEYLRKVADMEWKKEYTTANITVDMSNYNTINSDADLDGIVTKLSDKLREEMNVVAEGVYAY